MRGLIFELYGWVRSFRKLKTLEEVKELKLHFRKNVFGDEIME